MCDIIILACTNNAITARPLLEYKAWLRFPYMSEFQPSIWIWKHKNNSQYYNQTSWCFQILNCSQAEVLSNTYHAVDKKYQEAQVTVPTGMQHVQKMCIASPFKNIFIYLSYFCKNTTFMLVLQLLLSHLKRGKTGSWTPYKCLLWL